MLSLALAARNLFRHRVRSAIAFSVLIFGVVSLLLSRGFIDWICSGLRESTIQIIIALIIILSTSNTITKNVLERTNEIGTLMAMGMRRRKVLKLFVTEGMLLGVIGGLIGLILGTVLAHVISKAGIQMPPPPGASRGFTGEIRLSWPLAATSYFLAVGAATLASMFPAWKASRINIIDALRHNR